MHKSEFPLRLATAVQAEVPAILPDILAACDMKNAGQSKRQHESSSFAKEDMSPSRNTVRHYFNRKLWLSLAATLILLCGGVYFTYAQYTVTTVVTMDVNPGVELRTNRSEKVLSAAAQNADGKDLLKSLNLEGMPLEDAINAVVASLLADGYVNGQTNSLLLTVECGNMQTGIDLQQRLTQALSRLLDAKQVNGAILSQALQSDDELHELAEQYQISIGKAALLRQLTHQNAHYDFAALAALPISDLHLLAKETKTALSGILSTGTPGSGGYIGHEQAKNLALAHAKQTKSTASALDCYLDWDNVRMVYTVAFDSDGNRHALTLDAKSGKVLTFTTVPTNAGEEPMPSANSSTVPDSTTQNHTSMPHTQPPLSQTTTLPQISTQTTPSASGQTSTSVKATSTTSTSTPTTTLPVVTLIGESRAKEITLVRANLGSGFTVEMEVDLERKNGKQVYEVEFEQGNIEYTCIIDAVTGDIISWEED